MKCCRQDNIPGTDSHFRGTMSQLIHGGKNPTPEHLKRLLRIALRQESDRLDAGDNYAMGDTESEDGDTESDHNSEPESESTENDEISEIINIYSY